MNPLVNDGGRVLSGKKVLVVEDEGIEALDIQHRLIVAGYTVPGIAMSGEDAIDMAREMKPDIVVMDIMLQGELDGVKAARQIRDLIDIPVIYLTAFADDGTLERAKITEPYGYIVKPVKERELIISIEMALYKHKMEKSLEEEVRKAYACLEERVIQRTAALQSANVQLIEEIKQRHLAENKLQDKNTELNRACAAKDSFLAKMSHELRTPLNAIIGFTGTLLMKLPGPLAIEQEMQLNNVLVSAKYLLSLINDLLDLSKIESGKVELKHELFSCGAAIKEISNTMKLLAENKGLSLNCNIPEPDPMIRTDRRALIQILINLVNNAINYTEKGEVTISVECTQLTPHRRIEISVIDTGIGILPKDQGNLFEAFTRVGAHCSDEAGLGLYLSNKMADLLGGEIVFTSEYGKGSVFTLILNESRATG